MPTRARDRLVETAGELFYSEGVRAVGIERLLAVSGVGRASFYRHFASKDDLVVATLRDYGERWCRRLEQQVAVRGGGPLAVFDALADSFEQPAFRGCASINAMVEAADRDSAAHRVAAEHKRAVTDYIDGLLERAGYEQHGELAEQFMILVDGAIITAVRERGGESARRAKAVASVLLG
ncbi:TetR/AcrR family transcriptional regulator [Streptomyces spongiae]|uniref:TetR/AcrR family transcriptional regulator n=1 Tax=Streptomyces spongiae TaxID=565072 RepID=A0A5N8X9K5_9ACTN|nr:TetR/AcrR family transcriptional regulator [Streptomyces spongiae]MPY56149.1 TetR/AcrR family transcriptional regulator [Streptomyces spongiae]